MKTYLAKTGELERGYIMFDASEAPVGRLAVKIANALRGKDKPTYTPHIDTGAFVIVVNADKAVFTGRKSEEKLYVSFSRYRGGRKELTAKEVRANNPERMIKDAVWGMLPHGRLGRAQYRKLKVYAGSEHPHEAQKPIKVTV
ncbi:MAG: 50S ribosomal protein L13 [Victivallaceae bacterium]